MTHGIRRDDSTGRIRRRLVIGLAIPLLTFLPGRLFTGPASETPAGRGTEPAAGLPAGELGGMPVGYRVLRTEAPGRDGHPVTIDIAVWYPSRDQERRHRYPAGRRTVATRVAVDGEAMPGPHPLVLFLHGAGGSGLGAAFLTEKLAAGGYLVAAPDFSDPYSIARIGGPVPRPSWGQMWRMGRWFRDLREYQLNEAGKAHRKNLAYRPLQAKAALDRLLAESRDPDSPLAGRVDPERIALVGHSFGAWTALLVGGADPEFADPRPRAIVALSGPCNGNVYEPGELARIRVPVLFMYGEREPAAGRQSDRRFLYEPARPPKFLLEIAGADHLTFAGLAGREYASVGDFLARDPRRATIVRYTEAFLDWFLSREPGAKSTLLSRNPHVASYLGDMSGD